jgi:hypothetical protein
MALVVIAVALCGRQCKITTGAFVSGLFNELFKRVKSKKNE